MDDMTKHFAKAIYNRRKELGLTQDELAARIGTSKQIVSRYELAQRSPKVVMANKFAEALGTTLDQLMGESYIISTNEMMAIEQPIIPKTEEAKIIARIVDKLNKSQRKKVLDIMYAMYPSLKEGV